jgi:uncharacterized protein (TIGR03435 family)
VPKVTLCQLPANSILPGLPLWMVFACVFIAALCAHGQAGSLPSTLVSQSTGQPAAAPVFAVAAIHIDKSDPSARSHILSSPTDGHFRAINVPLNMLLQWAFAIPDTRIVGGPSWLGQAKFDIEATADPSVDDQLRKLTSAEGRLQKQKMLQALLADRFQLQVHEESRQLPLYALVLAKNGPKFAPSQVNGTTVDTRRTEISISGSDDTLALLADALARSLGRPVVNQTGLHGRYELDLKWAPDDVSRPGASGGSDSDSPSLFTAIQEQLGLKLLPQKGPVSVLVLDHVEMPSEN